MTEESSFASLPAPLRAAIRELYPKRGANGRKAFVTADVEATLAALKAIDTLPPSKRLPEPLALVMNVALQLGHLSLLQELDRIHTACSYELHRQGPALITQLFQQRRWELLRWVMQRIPFQYWRPSAQADIVAKALERPSDLKESLPILLAARMFCPQFATADTTDMLDSDASVENMKASVRDLLAERKFMSDLFPLSWAQVEAVLSKHVEPVLLEQARRQWGVIKEA